MIKKNDNFQHPKPKTAVSLITRDEEKSLASVLDRGTALLMRFLLETGCTVSESLRFLDAYSNAEGRISGTDQRTSETAALTLPAGFFSVDIAEGRRRRGSGEIPARRVFCRRRLMKEISTAFTASPKLPELPGREALAMRLKRASQTAVGKSVTPAVLRHTCAARLFCAGADLITVSAYLGHASPSITAALYLDAPGFPLPGRPVSQEPKSSGVGEDSTSNYSDPWFTDLVRYLTRRPVPM